MTVAQDTQQVQQEFERVQFELNHRLVQLEVLYQAGMVLSASLASDELQADFMRLAVGAVDARSGFLFRRADTDALFELIEATDDVDGLSLASQALQQAMAAALIAQEPAALTSEDLPGVAGAHVVVVPIGDNVCLGVIDKESRKGVTPFTEMDLQLLSMMGQQAGVVLDNARLFHRMEAERNLTGGILDSVEAGVVSTDLRGNILRSNPVAARILGRPSEELPGVSIVELLRAGGCTRLADAVGQTLMDGASRVVEQETMTPTDVQLNARITGLRTPDQELGGAVIAIEDLTDRFRLESMFKQYASDQVVDMLLSSGHVPALGGEMCEATVLFVDTVGSTELLGRIGGAEMVTLINECFTELVEIVLGHGGTLDKYTGDGFMAVFGAPLARPDDTTRSIRCALDVLASMEHFNESREHRLDIKIGISRGQVVAGNIGSPRRMEYSVIGPDVVLAARLCDMAAAGQILVSSDVQEQLGDDVAREHLGRHIFKGMRESMDVFRVHPSGAICSYEPDTSAVIEDRVALDVPMTTNMEVVVSRTARAVGENLGLAADVIDEIIAALVEACINAFEHSKSKSARLRLEFVPSPEALTIVVSDQGHGFDVADALSRIRARRERGEMRRGWGLELIGEFMDDMHIESGPEGTTLTLIKNREPQQPREKQTHG